MNNRRYQFSLSDLNLMGSQIEELIGYKAGESQEMISELISQVLKEAAEICRIKAEVKIFSDLRFIDNQKVLTLHNLDFNVKRIVYGQLKKSEAIAVFLCTAGEDIGVRSRDAMTEGDLLKGYIYDIVGSEIVEAAADLMQNDLEVTMNASGKKITNRYSPGYCGWDVAEQEKLFQLMPDNFCGIHLTDSSLMYPIKSVSGFIGTGENVKLNPYTCRLCDVKDCIFRGRKLKKTTNIHSE